MKTHYIIIFILTMLAIHWNITAQQVKGHVYENSPEEGNIPLPGVNVVWLGTNTGTVTNDEGFFSVRKPGPQAHMLVLSYVGYISDTLHIHQPGHEVEVFLRSNLSLDAVTIHGKQKGSHLDRLNPIHTAIISQAGLQQAACCNLSESFENSATVDVHYSDALTGAKQIELLGLAGVYSQMMTENIPNLRGLSSTFGLNYIPGSWMESIQVSKGASSVVNGFESITGQINIEYKKPEESEAFYFNMYANSLQKVEGNINFRVPLSDKWSTIVMAHGENEQHTTDVNGDGFMDLPMMKQYNLMNRWMYQGTRGLETRFGVSLLEEERVGGEMRFNPEAIPNPENGYGILLNTRRAEAYWKTGFVFTNRPATSIGLITQLSHHNQSSIYGYNQYNGRHNSSYVNLLFQSWIGDVRHGFTTGISLVTDNFSEKLNTAHFARNEVVPGAFFQYTYKPDDSFTLMTGIRADRHNLYGLFYTPRVHLRYNLSEHTTIRASAGKGYRTASVFAENSYLLASSRELELLEEMEQEKAWNMGATLAQSFHLRGNEWTFSAEFHRTDFQNQVVIDIYQDPDKILVYNLDGKSYSNSLQMNLAGSPLERLDVVLGYRLNDVKTTINGELADKPLVNRTRGLASISYATRLSKWQFDLTYQYNGRGRLSPTNAFPPAYQRADRFDPFSIINGQITRRFKHWHIYTGVENLTNFRQTDPILAADDPFGPYFDASMVWGPIVGRKIYAGIRVQID